MTRRERPDLTLLSDFLFWWENGSLGGLLHYGIDGGAAGAVGESRLCIGAAIRLDDRPDLVDATIPELRAEALARADEAIVVLETAGWELRDPRVTLRWGPAATWLDLADPGGTPARGNGVRRVLCWLEADLVPTPAEVSGTVADLQ